MHTPHACQRQLTRARDVLLGAALLIAVNVAADPAAAQQAENAVQSVSAAKKSAPDEANDDQAIAKKLSNPIASLVSVPFQFNYDEGFNRLGTGKRLNLNVQPVIPIELSSEWNLISRTIMPFNWSDDMLTNSGSITGMGDTVQSFFLTPSKAMNGISWGLGPVFLLPTGTSDVYTSHEWGAGPTGVILKESGPWMYGALVNHIWSFANTGTPAHDINATFMQPFIVYTTPDAWTYAVNTETTYDWNAEEWQVPVNATVSKVVKIGSQRVSLSAGARYYITSPDAAADGWGGRFGITFLFPK